MNKRNTKYSVLLLLGVLMLLSLSSLTAANGDFSVPHTGGLTLAEANAVAAQSVRYPDGRVQVIVTLSGQPAVDTYVAAGGRNAGFNADSAARAVRAQLNAQQDAFVEQASGFYGAHAVTRTQFLVNTVTIAVQPAELVNLSNLPNVVKVSPDRLVERADTTSVPFIGAPVAWGGTLGGEFTGDGQVIAVVDTGIDYTHKLFGGNGDYSSVADDTVLEGIPAGLFPAAWSPETGFASDGAPKVVGGWDLVGNAYTGYNTPQPDPNPLDCSVANGGGHGSHVAGSAAGWGVVEGSTTSTYAGPFEQSIYTDLPNPTMSFRIGPGVAPRAALVALRLFGCDGSTSTSNILNSFEYAVTGEVVVGGNTLATFPKADVINMSLGSGFGDGGADDPSNVASAAVAAAGVTFVASAGNSGDIFFITGSPSGGNTAISIASSVDTHSVVQGRVTRNDGAGAPAEYPAPVADWSPQNFADLTGEAVLGLPADGCAPLTNAAAVAGKIVVLYRGTCEFSAKGNAAFAAGASGLIVGNNQPGAPILMGNGTTAPIVGGYNLPSVMISQDDAADLAAAITAGVTNVTITDVKALGFVAEAADTLSDFSSRGPVTNSEFGFKPDIAAPGQTINSARAGSGDGVYIINGTSMAAPHMAGVMAVIREARPTWTVAEVKALVMNTANNDLTKGSFTHSPQRAGTGRVDVVDALSTDVIAYAEQNPEGVSLTFGFPEVVSGTTYTDTRKIVLENKGTSDETYTVGFAQRSDAVGVSFSVSPASVTVPAGSTATVDVTVTANLNVAGVHANSDPTLTVVGANRHRLTEESGLVTFTGGTGADLRVAVYAAPRLYSEVTATYNGPVELTAPTGSFAIDIAGNFALTGYGAADITSTASVVEHVFASSGPDSAIPARIDVKNFGITSNYPYVEDVVEDGAVFFAFETYGEWNSLNEVAFGVYVDLNQDGNAEFLVINGSSGGVADQNAVVFVDINNFFGGGTDAAYGLGNGINGVNANLNTYVINNSVVVLPFYLGYMDDLLVGIADADPAFDYWIETESYRSAGDKIGSASQPFTYDPSAPKLIFDDTNKVLPAQSLFYADEALSYEVDYDFTDGAVDALVLFHTNASAFGRSAVIELGGSVVTPTPSPEPTETSTPSVTPTPTVTVTPEPEGTELIVNGGFEVDLEGSLEGNWKVKNATKDKVKTDKPEKEKFFAHTGANAFMFKGGAGENSKILQKPSLDGVSAAAGDSLVFSLFADIRKPSNAKYKVVIKYSDSAEKTKITGKLENATEGYVAFAGSETLLTAGANKIKVVVGNKSTSGKLFVDDVSLRLVAGTVTPTEEPTGLPTEEPTAEPTEEDGLIGLPAGQ